MKLGKYICAIACLFICGCSMFHNEAERGIKKDVKEYLQEPAGREQVENIIMNTLDNEFDGYAKRYQDKTINLYKGRIGWLLGIISIVIGLMGGTGFTVSMIKDRKKKRGK